MAQPSILTHEIGSRVWRYICGRKRAYTLEAAVDKSKEPPNKEPYLCPFSKETPHYHIGSKKA
jgi:hypothetical protein